LRLFRLNPGAGIWLKPDTSLFAKVCWASDADGNNSAVTANDVSDAPYVGMALYLLLRVTWAVGDFCSPASGVQNQIQEHRGATCAFVA